MQTDAARFLNSREVASLNKSKLCYATSINTFGFIQLEIELSEAYVNESLRGKASRQTYPPELAFLYESAAPIQINPGGKGFRIFWKLCIAYCVTEELVGSCGHHDEEQFEGSILRVYEASNFLIHLNHDTGGHTGDLKHIKLITLNHLIDVAFYDWPEIAEVPPDQRLLPL
jgi:hypothetical protein